MNVTNKSLTLLVLRVLQEYSDEKNVMNARKISDKIEEDYGLKPDRRTVYTAVQQLQELGYEILGFSDTHEGYYLATRDLETEQARLLMDAVNTFPFLSEEQTKRITAALCQKFSMNQKKKLRGTIRAERKSTNPQFFLSVSSLYEAIEKHVKVSFDYYKYNDKKVLVPREKGRMEVSPYFMTFTNGRYYLVCYNPEHPDAPSELRIDRMKNVRVSKQPAENKFGSNELDAAVNASIYAYAGKPEHVVLIIDKTVLSDVIDAFGSSVRVFAHDETHLKVTFNASPRGLKYWALQYLEHCRVEEPVVLKNEIKNLLRFNPYTLAEREE